MSGLLVFDVSRRTAYRLLLAIGFPAVFALTLWLTPAKPVSTTPTTPQTLTDRELFTAVVDGMRTGRSYYEVYGAESRTRGYPTRSVFNWRTPLLLPAIASLTPRLCSLLFMALALALLVQAHSLLRRELLWVLTLAPAALVALVPGEIYFTESWAGVCLGLSAVAYARRRETAGASWALLALFIRELAAPYCVFAALLALYRRRWREVGMWLGGAVLYALYFGAHVWLASRHVLPGDRAHSHSWLFGGGLPFVFQLWQRNVALIAAPAPMFALVVTLAVAAWWAPKMPVHVRATVVLYSALFLFIGLPFNTYWGELIAPLVGLWMVYIPEGLSTVWAGAQLSRTSRCSTLTGTERIPLTAGLDN